MPDKREEEPSQHTNHENTGPDSPLNRVFQNWGLFDSDTPQGKDPTTYPIQVIDQRSHQVDMLVYQTPCADPALTQAWPTWSKSIRKILMAYEGTVFPLLETAEKEFAKNTPYDPFEHGPASYQAAITEAIRDAQANPGKDTQEFPHRAPIKLNDEEFAILLKITKARGLPSPEKHTFSYTDHIPLLEARREAVQKSPAYLSIQERMIREGILKPRAQIQEETRQRQAPWTSGAPKTPRTPGKPQK